MASSSFVMRPTKSHIGRYLTLILCPHILLLIFRALLITCGVLSYNQTASTLLLALAVVLLVLMVIFFLVQKQCTLIVKNHSITKIRLFGAIDTVIKAKQIHHTRKNPLNELLLFDKHGNQLLCVPPHLENRILFDEWLLDHGIRC